MRKVFFMSLIFVIGISVGLAAPIAKHLIDATPGEGVLVNLDKWFAEHPVTPPNPSRSDKVFESPRCLVNLVTNKGPLMGKHIHTNVDEIVFVYKGSGEIYLNGKWTPVKAGDLHVCPRGIAHATRCVADKEMLAISIFAPPQPAGGDRVMLDD